MVQEPRVRGGREMPHQEGRRGHGKSIEYDHEMGQFKEVVLKGFDDIITEFMDVPHAQKYVMDRIYFPEQKTIPPCGQTSSG